LAVILEIIFVGTGSGKTQLKRFHTSLFIKNGNHNLLIDTGDGISKALLYQNINLNDIDSIFITHTHADHFSGISSLLTQMKMAKRIKPLKIFVNNLFINFVRSFLYYSFLFPKTFNFEVKILGFDSDIEIKLNDSFSLIPIKNTHIYNKYNVNVLPNNIFTSNSVFIKSKDSSVYYSSDISSISDLTPIYKFNPKYFIVESTHISFNELVNFIINSDLFKTFLVHINDNDGIVEKYSELEDEIRKKMFLTFDGMNSILT